MPSSSSVSLESKAALLAECVRRQQAKADESRRAMDDAQASANDASGAMEDKFESFREACQIQRDLFARQLDEALTGLATLRRLTEAAARTGVGVAPPPVAGLGAALETDRGGRFLLAISLGPVPDPAGGAPWLVVSSSSPIGHALVGRRVGDAFTFRNETHRVTGLS